MQRLRRLLGRRSSRFDEGAFVIEGTSLLSQAFLSGWDIESVFLASGTVPEALDVPRAFAASSISVFELAPKVMERVASTETPPPLLSVVRIRSAPLSRVGETSFVVVGDRINDPGNAGTMLRSAEAAGAGLVVFTEGSVDVFNPKVVRASAGALFTVGVVVAATLEAVIETARAARPPRWVFGTSSHHLDSPGVSSMSYLETDFTVPTVLVLGNEAQGLSADADVDAWVSIPHAGRSESLNVAMAATVLAFEVARQRSTTVGNVSARPAEGSSR